MGHSTWIRDPSRAAYVDPGRASGLFVDPMSNNGFGLRMDPGSDAVSVYLSVPYVFALTPAGPFPRPCPAWIQTYLYHTLLPFLLQAPSKGLALHGSK